MQKRKTILKCNYDFRLIQFYDEIYITYGNYLKVYLFYLQPENIARFPSDYFYEDNLQVGTTDQRKPSCINIWPGGQDHPYLFCHVIGREEEVIVDPKKDKENSYSNDEEVNNVVSIHLQHNVLFKSCKESETIGFMNYEDFS